MNLSINPNPEVHLKLRHEDEDLVVIDKPQGVVTQPGKGHQDDTILNALFARFGPQLQNLGRARDFGLLHRLDKHTSGLLVAALKPRAYDALRDAFATRAVRKFYWALAHRPPNKPAGVINRPILEVTGGREDSGFEEREGQKLAKISSAGKPAVTAYRTLAIGHVGQGAALLECRPVTGRLHQVRVHLASIGCELLGDAIYAKPPVSKAAPRVMLHSHRLVFTHPVTNETIDVRSPCPKDMKTVLTRFGLPLPTVDTPSGLPAEQDAPDAPDAPDAELPADAEGTD